MQEDLRALLSGIGSTVIAWGQMPQGSALPAVVLTTVSQRTDYTYSDAADLTASRVQADIYAPTYAAATAIDRAIVALVSGYRGTVGTTEFLGIFLESRFDGAEETVSGALVHRISRDLMVNHKET